MKRRSMNVCEQTFHRIGGNREKYYTINVGYTNVIEDLTFRDLIRLRRLLNQVVSGKCRSKKGEKV